MAGVNVTLKGPELVPGKGVTPACVWSSITFPHGEIEERSHNTEEFDMVDIFRKYGSAGNSFPVDAVV